MLEHGKDLDGRLPVRRNKEGLIRREDGKTGKENGEKKGKEEHN